MKNTMLKLFLITLLSFSSFFALANGTQAKSYMLYETDSIDAIAMFDETGILSINFNYISIEKKQNIHWEGNSVDPTCSVYGILKNSTGGSRMFRVATKRELLESDDQKIYIDISKDFFQIYEKGFVQCNMTVGLKNYQPKDEFYFETSLNISSR